MRPAGWFVPAYRSIAWNWVFWVAGGHARTLHLNTFQRLLARNGNIVKLVCAAGKRYQPSKRLIVCHQDINPHAWHELSCWKYINQYPETNLLLSNLQCDLWAKCVPCRSALHSNPLEQRLHVPACSGQFDEHDPSEALLTIWFLLLQLPTLGLGSVARRGCKLSCPVTFPSHSSATCSVCSQSTVDGPTSACASSSDTSSIRTLPSHQFISGMDSSPASLHRWANFCVPVALYIRHSDNPFPALTSSIRGAQSTQRH